MIKTTRTYWDWNTVFVLMVTDPVETVRKPYLLRRVPCSIDHTQTTTQPRMQRSTWNYQTVNECTATRTYTVSYKNKPLHFGLYFSANQRPCSNCTPESIFPPSCPSPIGVTTVQKVGGVYAYALSSLRWKRNEVYLSLQDDTQTLLPRLAIIIIVIIFYPW